jgi:hypothetical protein
MSSKLFRDTVLQLPWLELLHTEHERYPSNERLRTHSNDWNRVSTQLGTIGKMIQNTLRSKPIRQILVGVPDTNVGQGAVDALTAITTSLTTSDGQLTCPPRPNPQMMIWLLMSSTCSRQMLLFNQILKVRYFSGLKKKSHLLGPQCLHHFLGRSLSARTLLRHPVPNFFPYAVHLTKSNCEDDPDNVPPSPWAAASRCRSSRASRIC